MSAVTRLGPGGYPVAVSLLTSNLAAPLLTNTNTLPSPTITAASTISAPLLSDADTLYTPTITASSSLAAPLLTNIDTIYSPTITTGPITITPPLLSDVNVIYNPTMVPGAVTLHMPLLDENDVFPGPTITSGIIINAPLLTNSNGFFGHDFIPGAITLHPPLLSDADTLYSPTITVGSVVIAPELLTNTSQIFNPVIISSGDLGIPLLVNSNILPTPKITSNTTISMPLLSDADVLLIPTITGGGIIYPPLLADTDILYPPTIQKVKTQGNGGGGGGGGTVTSNLKYASLLTLDSSGLITALQTQASAAKTINTRMVIYADNGGSPGVLLAQSAVKSNVVVGINTYPLITSYAALQGTSIWIALHSDGNFSWFLQTSPSGARYNTDLFSDGPSDPFGPASIDNRKAPLFVVILEAVNATLQMPLLVNNASPTAPALSPGVRTLIMPIAGQSFLYPPSIVAEPYPLEMPIVQSSGTLYPPVFVKGGITIDAPLLTDVDNLYPPTIIPPQGYISPPRVENASQVFSPSMSNDLQVLSPELIDNGSISLVPTISTSNELLPQVVNSGETLFEPTISVGGITLEMSLFVNSEQLVYDPTFHPEIGFLTAPLLTNDNVLYPPLLAKPKRVHHVSLIGRGSNKASLSGTIRGGIAIIEGEVSQIELEGNDA